MAEGKHQNEDKMLEKYDSEVASSQSGKSKDISFAGTHVRAAVSNALLATALVRFVNQRGEKVIVRALLDQGYQSMFIRRDILQEIKIPISKTDENVQKITDLIKENPRTTLLELEQDTGISKTTIGRIVTEDLKLKKTPAKFIPRFLSNEQKLCRLATCEDMMEMTRTDPEWKDKIITGDETWVYGYDPETKPQSAEWRDIAPNDFFLFPKLKAVLKGRHFDTRDDIIEKSPLALKSIPKEAYKNCFDNWEKRWR
ncbi:hypothetical protein LAZ67_X004042 [Cordylochernes scorpioides]|uniref:Uncharacterized protein n=1 Tax=Cordylochernes scorpioides TaxID=51811 RepID=A0ABY6LUK0_9ARAC|nr:hypothetical protein LAZ67_X004042 [Cordylochernes scorpioides]